MRLPDFFTDLFRNYDFDTIDDEKHYKMIIKTVLSRGTLEQITWLFQHYGKGKVREVFREDYYGLRTLPEATRSLWELAFIEKPLQEDNSRASRWRWRRLSRTETGI